MKILFLFLLFTVSSLSYGQSGDSTDYFLKACGGGFGGGKVERKNILIGDAAVNKTTVQYVVSKMITAHGGMAKWNAAPTLSFTHILVFGQPLETEFWISNETTEIKTERTYHDWPAINSHLASDGKKVWTENWKLDNPPGTNVNNIYTAMAMPWLTQKKTVKLEAEPLQALPGDSAAHFVIRLTYAQPSKESPHKYYKLFIHPETFLLKGMEFNITYAPFLDLIGLPKEIKSLGPFTHVFYEHTPVDGLIFPKRYDSFNGEGHNSGKHMAYNYSIKKPFDVKRMSVPAGATVADEKSDR